jgi:hypothetical protein
MARSGNAHQNLRRQARRRTLNRSRAKPPARPTASSVLTLMNRLNASIPQADVSQTPTLDQHWSATRELAMSAALLGVEGLVC